LRLPLSRGAKETLTLINNVLDASCKMSSNVFLMLKLQLILSHLTQNSQNQVDHALAFWDVVIYSWRVALEEVVLGVIPSRELPWGKKEFEGLNSEHLNAKQAIATLQMTEVCDLIQVDMIQIFSPV